MKDRVRQLEKELQEAKATNCQLQFLFDRAVVAFIGTIMLNEFSIGADTEVMAQLFVEHEKFSELLPDDLAIQPWMEARFKEVVTRNTAA